MEILQNELNKINSIILNEFQDLLPDNTLISFIGENSKRIRSILPLLYFKSLNAEMTDNIYYIIAAGEIVHNASLLHDDVIDNSEMRRKNPTINRKYNNHISILCGDYLISHAINKLLHLKNTEILYIFNDCVRKMSQAEIQQYFLRNKTPNIEEYINICRGKTASLFIAIFVCCAKLLNMDIREPQLFAELFGMTFQIKNDLEQKSSDEDIKNGVRTAVNIIGIEKTVDLLDNYKKEMFNVIDTFSYSFYKIELERLIKEL